MTAERETLLTPLDLALLEALALDANLVRACRRLGIPRDRGVYRLARLRRAAGGPVARTNRGGAGAGATRLTPLGERLRGLGRGGLDLVHPGAGQGRLPAVILRGPYRARPAPGVRLGRTTLWVGFGARDGEPVSCAIDPESVLVALARFPTSARNVLDGVVTGVHAHGPGPVALAVRAAGRRLVASVTPGAVRSLRLARGRRVVLYIKATAIRRVDRPTRGSPRS